MKFLGILLGLHAHTGRCGTGLKPGSKSSAHLDKWSKQHRVLKPTIRSAGPQSASPLFSKTTRSHALFTLQRYMVCPPACLRRRVCTRALIGQAHLSVRGWLEVKTVNACHACSCCLLCVTIVLCVTILCSCCLQACRVYIVFRAWVCVVCTLCVCMFRA